MAVQISLCCQHPDEFSLRGCLFAGIALLLAVPGMIASACGLDLDEGLDAADAVDNAAGAAEEGIEHAISGQEDTAADAAAYLAHVASDVAWLNISTQHGACKAEESSGTRSSIMASLKRQLSNTTSRATALAKQASIGSEVASPKMRFHRLSTNASTAGQSAEGALDDADDIAAAIERPNVTATHQHGRAPGLFDHLGRVVVCMEE